MMRSSKRSRSARVEVVADDRISKLDDDILVSIISRLPFKEATATSVLSTRWRPLHTRISRLNFPPFPCWDYFSRQDVGEVEKIFQEYIKMMDHTLDSYEGGRTLEEFRVHVYRFEGPSMKRWLEFALSREVEIIDIRIDFLMRPHRIGCYCLQLENLSRQSLAGLKCLRELSLNAVEANDADFKILLSNSPNLETLSLECPQLLTSVSMVGHPKLRHFSISHCELKSIRIENMISLVSLSIQKLPRTCALLVNNVPKLMEFNAADQPGLNDNGTVGELLFKLSSCILSQLLLVRFMPGYLRSNKRDSLPELVNVKHLVVEWKWAPRTELVIPLIRLIEACRSLEKFEMKVKRPLVLEAEIAPQDFFYEYCAVKECSPHLKEVKVCGYLGSPTEWEVAAFVIKYAAPTLQELIVQTCDTSETYRQIANANVQEQLVPMVPKSVNLVII